MGCVAANAALLTRYLESSEWRRWAGRQGGRAPQNFLEINCLENICRHVPPQRRAGPFRFQRWGGDQPMGSDSSPRSFRTSGAGGGACSPNGVWTRCGEGAAPNEYSLGAAPCPATPGGPVPSRSYGENCSPASCTSAHTPSYRLRLRATPREWGPVVKFRRVRRPAPLATPPLGVHFRRVGE